MATQPNATDVFRFLAVRPPEKLTREDLLCDFFEYSQVEGARSPLHDDIKQAIDNNGNVVEDVTVLAKGFLGSEDYVPGFKEDDPFSNQLRAAYKTLIELEANTFDYTALIGQLTTDLGGSAPDVFVASADYTTAWDAQWDALYAHAILPRERPQDREDVLSALRLLHVLSQLPVLPATRHPGRYPVLAGPGPPGSGIRHP